MRNPFLSAGVSTVVSALLGCSGSNPDSLIFSTGGTASTVGGSSQTPTAGGVPSSGGTATGTTSGGAINASGGTNANMGGVINATGGKNSPVGGSNSNTGGKATGGNSTNAGGVNTGGARVSGGTSAGGTAAGGSMSTGGKATGGAAIGGWTSTGGKAAGGSATGGAVSTGGASTAVGGGSTATFTCSNLRSPAGTTGKAKPAGAVGGLKVLDWAGFIGAVSFTFDDGNSSQITNYSQLQATGARATFFLVTGWSNAANAVFKTALTDGHEIGNHTKSHSSTASVTDLQAAEDWIQSTFGVTAYSMAAPNGDASWASVAGQVLLLNRGVSNGLIGPRDSTNQYSLPAYIPPSGAGASTMDVEVNAAKSANKWKIFCVHGFTGDTSAYQPVDVTGMATTMSNAVKNGVWADTMTNVGAYWLGQKLISTTATTSATWTLPSHFPPSMCLRVTTTGGTVKQNGAAVPWNDHGYYEISLDAKAVSVE